MRNCALIFFVLVTVSYILTKTSAGPITNPEIVSAFQVLKRQIRCYSSF